MHLCRLGIARILPNELLISKTKVEFGNHYFKHMWNQDEEGLKRVAVIQVTSSEAAWAGTYQPRRLHIAPNPPLVHFKTLTFESPRAQQSSGTLLSCTSTAGALPENNLKTHVLFSEPLWAVWNLAAN